MGIKLCWLLNSRGRVVAWEGNTGRVYDKQFNPLVQPFINLTILLVDEGFRDKEGVPENMKICKRGSWNARLCLETAFSRLVRVYNAKKIFHRLAEDIETRLAFISARFNVLSGVFHALYPHAELHRMAIAGFAL